MKQESSIYKTSLTLFIRKNIALLNAIGIFLAFVVFITNNVSLGKFGPPLRIIFLMIIFVLNLEIIINSLKTCNFQVIVFGLLLIVIFLILGLYWLYEVNYFWKNYTFVSLLALLFYLGFVILSKSKFIKNNKYRIIIIVISIILLILLYYFFSRVVTLKIDQFLNNLMMKYYIPIPNE